MSSQPRNPTYYSAFAPGALPTLRRWVAATLGSWAALILAGRGEQARDIVVRALLACHRGARVEAWRLHWYGLELHVSLWRLDAAGRHEIRHLSSVFGAATMLLCLVLARVRRPCWLRMLALDLALCAAWSTALPVLGAGAWQARQQGGRGMWAAVGLGLAALIVLSVWLARRATAAAFPPTPSYGCRLGALFLAYGVPLAAAVFLVQTVLFRPIVHGSTLGIAAFAVPALACGLAAVTAFHDQTRQLTLRHSLALLVAVVLVAAGGPVATAWQRDAQPTRQLRVGAVSVSVAGDPLPDAPLVALATASDTAMLRAAARLHLDPTAPLHLRLWTNLEQARMDTADGAPPGLDPRSGTIRLLCVPSCDLAPNPVPLEAIGAFLLRQRQFGRMNPWLLRGLAGVITDPEPGPDHFTAEQDGVMSVEGGGNIAAVLFPDPQTTDDAFVAPDRARALVGFLVEGYGLDRVLELARRLHQPGDLAGAVRSSLGVPLETVDQTWQQRWRQAISPATAATIRPPLPFQRGVALTAEGEGYFSPATLATLERLHALQVNAVALCPYAFSSGAALRYGWSHSLESDDGIRLAAAAAHRLGMTVFVKPQVWRQSGATSDLSFAAPSDWRTWFADYRRYILHEARLATAIHAELFSVGLEFPGLSLPPEHEADWRALVADVRRVYPGKVTYCANWGAEFERLPFADALDILGLNDYYPLAARDDAGDAEVAARMAGVVTTIRGVAQRTHRQVILTEVGFPSLSHALSAPWTEAGGGTVSPATQARGVRAVLNGIRGAPEIDGLYWWKWHSDGSGASPDDPGYMLGGKPAEPIIAQWDAQPQH